MRKLGFSLGLAAFFASGSAMGQSIGAYFDEAGTTCSAQPTLNHPGTLWVIAVLDGPALGGITGAEFRISGVPSSYFPSPTFASNVSYALGTPLQEGADVAFATCTTGVNRRVQLCRVDFFVTQMVPTTQITIENAATPSNRFFPCPAVTLCDFPAFTMICASGQGAVINGSCVVPVDQSTWSKVKQLYN